MNIYAKLPQLGLGAIAQYPLSDYSGAIFSGTQLESDDKVVLKLDSTPSDPRFSPVEITLPSRINEIAKSWTADNAQVVKIYVAFREFALGIIKSPDLLEKKIQAIAERSFGDEDPLRVIDGLFEIGDACREKADGRKGVLFIGDSGTGKTTTINHLCRCEMLQAPVSDFGKEPLMDPPETVFYVRGGGVSKIGQTTDSETLTPEIVIPPAEALEADTDIVFADFPGINDSRGVLVQIANALSVVDVVERLKEIQSALLFCEFGELSSAKYDRVQQNIKYLHMLLKNCEPYKEIIRFVITKIPPNINKKNIPQRLKAAIADVIQNNPQDDSLVEFCKQMLELQLYNNVLFCEPGIEANRDELMDGIRSCRPVAVQKGDNPTSFGYPISPQASAKIHVLRNALSEKTQKALDDMKIAFSRDMNAWVNSSTNTQEAQDKLKVVRRLKESLSSPLTLASFAGNIDFMQSATANAVLQECLEYWNKLGEVNHDFQSMDQRLAEAITLMEQEINGAIQNAEKRYYDFVYAEIKAALEQIVECYIIQKNVRDRRKELGDISLLQPRDFFGRILDWSEKTKVVIPYQDLMDTLFEDAFRVADWKSILQQNIIDPITIEGRGSGHLNVAIAARKIALSSIIKEMAIQPADKSVYVEAKHLFFNHDIVGQAFSGKVISIKADQIQTMLPAKVNLESGYNGGAFLMDGAFVGLSKFKNRALLLQPSGDQAVLKRISKQW